MIWGCYYRDFQMETQRNKFVKVFQNNNKNQVENIDPLTHSLPPRQLELSHNVIQLLEKVRDAIVCVSAIGFSTQFFSLVRKILLLDAFQEQTIQKKHNNIYNELYLSTKIEIVPIEPIQWIYGELKLKKYDREQTLSPIYIGNHELFEQRSEVSSIATFLGSSIIFAQIGCSSTAEQILNLIKTISSKMEELPGSFPKIYFILDAKNQSQNEFQQLLVNTKLRFPYQIVSAGDWAENWDQQFRLINLGKGVVQKLRPKIIDKVSINARFLSYLWSLIAAQEDKSAINAFHSANQTLIQEQSQQALNHYLSRIQEITEGQELLSSQFFKNVQAKVRTDIMRQVTQRTGALSQRDDLMKTERRLLEMKEQIESRNHKAVIEWARQLLKQSWSAIDKKIGKQIKSVSALRQQVAIFVEFFRKKSENYISVELLILLLDFLVPRVMEASQTVMSSIVAPLQQQQVASQTQIINLSNEIKDLRKKVGKQQGELSRKMMDLKEKNFQLQATLKITEKTLQMSRQESQQLRDIYEQKIVNITEEHQSLLKSKQEAIEDLLQRSEINIKKASLLENQLTKERLLHEQTRRFYEESIQNLKTREAELREELEQFSLSASREIDQMKSSSTKEIDNFQILNAQLTSKLSSLQQQLTIKEQTEERTRIELLKLKEQIKTKETLSLKVSQLQMRNKILQDMQVQCLNLRTKLKKNEEQIRRTARQKQQRIQQCRQLETKSLLVLEKYDYLEKKMQQEKFKHEQIARKMEAINNEKQLLHAQLQRERNRGKVDFGCQAEDNSVKEKLKIAIEMIKEIESEYSKLKAQNQTYYRRYQ